MNSYGKLVILFFVISCACVAIFALPASKERARETARATCVLPMERGMCRAHMARWGYDMKRKNCVQFFYGGCHGNENNFVSQEDCLRVCKGVDN